jgi:hypothetical protein
MPQRRKAARRRDRHRRSLDADCNGHEEDTVTPACVESILGKLGEQARDKNMMPERRAEIA